MNFFIDFEANSPTNEIISIGCVSETGDTFYEIMQCSTPLDSYVKRVTHLTQKDLDQALPPEEVFNHFFNWLSIPENATWNDLNFYHYGQGDINFIKSTIKNIKDKELYQSIAAMAMRMIDYEKSVRRAFESADSIALIGAANYFKEKPEDQTHNALDDAELLRFVYENIQGKPAIGSLAFDTNFNKLIRIKGDSKCGEYGSLEEALEFCMGFAKSNNVSSKTEKRVQNKLVNAIKNKTKYCGFNWRIEK